MPRDKRPTNELFDERGAINTEINNRAWDVLIAMGYKPFRKTTINVARFARGGVNIIQIRANFEQNFIQQEIEQEVPEQLFERMCGMPESA